MPVEIRELFWLGMGSRGFFQLVESIIEIWRNPIFGKKFLLGEDYSCNQTTDFLASGNHFFFSIFEGFLPVIDFFSSSEKVYFNKVLHSSMAYYIYMSPAGRNGFFWLVETETVFFG